MTENNTENERLGVFVSTKNLLKQTLDKKYKINFNGNSEKGILTGFSEIDKITKGFQNGELNTIALIPGIGKTTIQLSLIDNIAVYNNKKVGVFSAERSARKIFTRLLESSTGLSLSKINAGQLTDSQKNQVLPVIKNYSYAQIYIDDTTNPMAEDIIEKSKLMAKNGVEIIFIDYLELITTNLKSKDKACSKEGFCPIVEAFKNLAIETKIPIILFSQLSKPIVYNNRFKYTPDYINEISDVLLFLNRPEFYHINDIDMKEKGMAEVTIAKIREDTDFTLTKLKFVESLDKYTDY